MKQRVRVVVGSIDGDWCDLPIMKNACHVRPELRLQVFGNQLLTLFGAEDYVEMVFGIGMRHFCRPSRARGVILPVPHRSHSGLNNSTPFRGWYVASLSSFFPS